VSSLPVLRGPVLALVLLAVLALPASERASAASYGCSFCGHPSYHPWHYSSCRYYGLGLGSSSSGGSGGSQGGSSGGEALGSALGELIGQALRDWMERPQREAALRAERERQAALARARERQRQEQLRQARVRLAARLREDWDRRDAETAQRLEGVFDVTPPPGPSHSLGTEDSSEAEPESRLEASAAEPTSAPTAQQRLEARLRSPRCRDVPSPPPQAEIPSDPLTGRLIPIMTNPLSILPTQGPLHDALRDLAWQTTVEVRDHAVLDRLRGVGWEMVGDARDAVFEWMGAPGRAWTAYSAQTTFADELSKAVSPEMAVALRDGRGLGAHEARLDKAQVDLLRDLASDPSKRHENYRKKLRALLTGAEGD